LVPDSIRLPAFVLVIAALTTCAERLIQALDFSLYESLGIFLPLIVTNCLILGRAEALARRVPVSEALADGLGQGLGFGGVLIVLGGLREWLGDAILLAILPPGAFIGLGLLIAIHRALLKKSTQKTPTPTPSDTREKRVRTTGDVA